MSNNKPTLTTGVTGNTNVPQQQHAAAGSSATSNRLSSFIKDNKIIVSALALVAIYTVFVSFKSYSMGLGGLLVTLFLLRYVHKQYEKNSKPTMSSLIGHLITAAIALTLINTSFVQKPLEWFNSAEAGVAAGTLSLGSSCIDRDPVEEDGYFTLRKGCENQSIKTPAGFAPRFYIEDVRFPGGSTEWVAQAWDERRGNTMNFRHIKWPGGVNEVSVQMVSVERAAEIDTAAAAARF